MTETGAPSAPDFSMAILWLDFETRSRCDLKTAGVYNYAQDLSTADGKGSISDNHAAFQPSGAHATDAASMPEQTEPNRIRKGGAYSLRL